MTACSLCAHFPPVSIPELLIAGDDQHAAFLSDDWAVRGHAIVTSRHHVENLSDLSDEDARGFLDFFRRVERAILAAVPAERAILMKLGLKVPHLHLHIYPVARSVSRRAVIDAIEMRTRDEPSEAEKSALVARIRELLAD